MKTTTINSSDFADLGVPDDIEHYQFLLLARKYKHHWHKVPLEKGVECMLCEAINIIEGGRYEISIMQDAINDRYKEEPPF